MRHPMRRRGVLVAALLAALLAGSLGAADPAAADAAQPKGKDAHPAKAKPDHGTSHEHKHGHAHATTGTRSGSPTKPHQRRAASADPTAVALPLPPTGVPFRVAVPPAAVLRPELPTGTPFLRTARPLRPLVRPSVVPETAVRWQPHEPVEPPLLRALRTTAKDPTTPLLFAALLGLFLLVQNRIDRDDPKLSLVHRTDPTDLRFGPARRLTTAL